MKAVSLLLYKKILDKGRISEGTISTKEEKSQVIFYESAFLKSCCCFYLTKGLPSDTIVDGIQTEKNADGKKKGLLVPFNFQLC